MFIKRLELLGFKTFADKTCIEFSEGITAIVGPNGSGKSNIVDALLWVLGESNIRNLRGQRVTDVIFNGSETRRAVGMAEVSLTLDNSSRILPLEFNEVTITRRAYRSGEGEFFINRARCRLKDIYELFLDTGLGSRGAYSIVGQGEIDAVLSAKPEDRRDLFEEAAGVKKYRYRREEALRKLERTEANLRRVCDVMAEIGTQLEPLAEQAELAKRYNELQARLWDIEVGLLIRDLKRLTNSISETRAAKKQAETLIEQLDEKLVELDNERTRISATIAKVEEELEVARRAVQSIFSNVQRLENQKAIVEERIAAGQGSKKRLETELSELTNSLEQAKSRARDLEAALASGSEKEKLLSSEVQQRLEGICSLEEELKQIVLFAEEQKSAYLDVTRKLAEKRSIFETLSERISQIEAVIERKTQVLSEIASSLEEKTRCKEQAVVQLRDLRTNVDKSQQEIANLELELERCRKRIAELRAEREKIARELAAQTSRFKTLAEMVDSHEGFYEGVRNVVDAARQGILAGEFAVVADVINVPEGLETAIETALGTSLQDVITDNVEQAKKAIEFLKSRQAGRATFLPLTSMRSPGRDIQGISEGRNGLIGIAANLVTFSAKYGPAIRSLLARVLIADNIDNALSISRQAVGWSKIVTLDGELILPSGALTGGVSKGRSSGLIARKQLVTRLQKTIKELEGRAERLKSELHDAEKDAARLESEVEAKRSDLAAMRSVLSEQEQLVNLYEHDIAALERQKQSTSTELSEFRKELADQSARIESLRSELANVDLQDSNLDGQLAGAEERVRILEKKLAEERDVLSQLKVDLAGLQERNRALLASLQDMRVSIGRTERAVQDRRSQLEAVVQEIECLRSDLNTFDAELSTQRQLLDAAQRRLKELETSRADSSRQAAELENRIKAVTIERNEKASEAHEADVKLARLEVQLNQVSDRLFEEYELSYDQALQWPEEELDIERGAVAEVARLRREIKEMGPVNTGAVQEYERIKERWDFLTEQRRDLENAKVQLTEAIREIDANTRGMFLQTFASVSTSFETTFSRLFGGGRAELTLTNPNDVLETGVEIAVQPPGKKLQDLALLSGGEKALTAAALIFALLMVRPSPLIVLDEVDAPLDEGNVERFAELVRGFAERSQFIVVTHNRATMEAADSLYGITMQEPGVSKVVSVRLASEESDSNRGFIVSRSDSIKA